MFLDFTGSETTGWRATPDYWDSGSGQVYSILRGQNSVSSFMGSSLSDLSVDTTHEGVHWFVVDEGTPGERRVLLDRYRSVSTAQVSHVLANDLFPGLHTLRVIGGIDKNPSATDYYRRHDAILTR